MTTTSAASRPRSASQIWRSVGRSAGARLLTLPLSAVLGIIVTRLLIDHFGEGAYAQYGLLVGIGMLLPFADLGMSTAVMNAIGESDTPSSDPHVVRVLTTAIRFLCVSGVVLLLGTAVITVTGSWSRLLGSGLLPHSGTVAAALCLILFSFTMVLGFAPRILTGLGRNHSWVLLTGLQTPLVLATLLVIIAVGVPLGGYIAVVAYAATLVCGVFATVLAARAVTPALGLAVRDVFRRQVTGARVFDVAWPTLVQLVALPIAMQTDRIVLSHVSDLRNLAEYNLSAQIFTPVWGVLNVASYALWPVFARARAQKEASQVSPLRLALGFGAAGFVACACLAVASPLLADLASGGQVKLGYGLIAAFAVFMIVQSMKFPLGVYLTDPRGLRFQAFMVLLLVPANLGLSIVLARHWGAVGPVVASAATVLVLQLAANVWWIRRGRADVSSNDISAPTESGPQP